MVWIAKFIITYEDVTTCIYDNIQNKYYNNGITLTFLVLHLEHFTILPFKNHFQLIQSIRLHSPQASVITINTEVPIKFSIQCSFTNEPLPPTGPYDTSLIITKQLRIEGFLVNRWLNRWLEGLTQLKQWVQEVSTSTYWYICWYVFWTFQVTERKFHCSKTDKEEPYS